MIAPLEGSTWADYWAAREAGVVPKNSLFDEAVVLLQDLRSRAGPQQNAKDLEVFDAVMVVLAAMAMLRRA